MVTKLVVHPSKGQCHIISTAVERAYRRTDLFDQRRKLIEEWARFCAGGC
jgi:hypothetical protein